MQRLLDDFATLFDLDKQVHGNRLGELIERTVEELEQSALPDWGSPGQSEGYETEKGRALDFYYLPHLFPEMDLKLRLAHKLQFHMLPRDVPNEAPMSIAAVLESYCHLSGDLFGWDMLADGRFLIWIVDLSGHGVRAGLASAVLKVLIDNLRQRGRVGSLVAELNDTFVECLHEHNTSLFATGFFMSVAADGSACYTSAAHPPGLLRRQDGTVDELSSNGLPIGLFRGSRYLAEPVRIEPGDTMLLYTDGVVETVNHDDDPFGLHRLRGLLAPRIETPRSLADSVYQTIASHKDMRLLDDDVTFVAARIGPGPELSSRK